MKNTVPTILLIFLLTSLAEADVRLNQIFGDNMVLQRDIPVKIYGTADAGERVSVKFAGEGKSTKAGKDGNWSVKLDAMPANSKPQVLKVNDVELTNILVGDVWLCTGQSNMAGMLKNYISFGEGMYEEYKNEPGDYRNDQIRLFTVKSVDSDTLQPEPGSGEEWAVCSPESSLDFSCTGYFFGKFLQPEAGVPIGLIKSAIGGTGIVSWLPKDTMLANPVSKRIYWDPYEQALERWPVAEKKWKEAVEEYNTKKAAGEPVKNKPRSPLGPNSPKRPAAYYNGMIFPLHQFAIKGAIWYQGENEGNLGVGEEYKTTFPLMIDTWRKRWDQGDFPFMFVQLAAFRSPQEEPSDPDWARLREAQLYTLKTVSNTGMAVAIDGGLTKNIHPPYKHLVGKRLAAEALRVAYDGKEVSQGPLFRKMAVKESKAVLRFDSIGSGMVSKGMILDAYGESPIEVSAKELEGFSIAGEDKVFYPATAVIKRNTVVVESPNVEKPVAVRYGWAEFPICNLYNKEGFAASPFRSDDWAQAN